MSTHTPAYSISAQPHAVNSKKAIHEQWHRIRLVECTLLAKAAGERRDERGWRACLQMARQLEQHRASMGNRLDPGTCCACCDPGQATHLAGVGGSPWSVSTSASTQFSTLFQRCHISRHCQAPCCRYMHGMLVRQKMRLQAGTLTRVTGRLLSASCIHTRPCTRPCREVLTGVAC